MALLPVDDKDFMVEIREASPAHLLIKIKSFSVLSEHGIREYESGEFVAGDYKWKLIIDFDGKGSENESGHVSAYLSLVDTTSLPIDWEVNAMFSVFLLNQISDKYICFAGKVQRFHAMNSKRGVYKIISMKSFTDTSNGYLVDDNCVFGAEVAVVKSQRVVEFVSVLDVTESCKNMVLIPEFSKLEDEWTSKEFSAGGHKWKIQLYLKEPQSTPGHVGLYVQLVDSESFGPHQKVKAHICVCLKNKIHNTEIHNANITHNFSAWYTSSAKSWGCNALIPIAEILDPKKGFVVDDCCFVKTKISVQAIVCDAPK